MAGFGLGILEDDAAQADRLNAFFAAQGLDVRCYADAPHALASIAAAPPHVLLLGASAEAATTLLVLRQIRERSRVPTVVLGSEDDISQVAILEAGADEVVPRSVPLRALLVRLRAILRRAEWGATLPPLTLTVNGWRLLSERRQLLRPDGSECLLTTAEFDLLQLLLESSGQAVSRGHIAGQRRCRRCRRCRQAGCMAPGQRQRIGKTV
jgi:DNA-binding response OmpR family regulator